MKSEFLKIFAYYRKLNYSLSDDSFKGEGYKITRVGLWASSRPVFVYYFFKKLSLANKGLFLDAGSGDGLVVAIASIFTRAMGIECDIELCKIACKAFRDIGISNANVFCGNYLDHKIWKADVIYLYPDKPINNLVKLLYLQKWQGELWIYGHHFPPEFAKLKTKLKKGKDFLTVYKINNCSF